MAKVGEGDPRWIVTSREDGTNPNDWHWVERDCFPWTKDKLKDTFSKIALFEQNGCRVTTKSVDVTGEATANNRKGKTIYLFEFDITVNWEAKWEGQSETASGTVHIPYVGDDNENEQWETKVTCSSKTEAAKKLLEEMHSPAANCVRKTVHEVVQHMKTKFATQRKQPAQSTQATESVSPVKVSASSTLPAASPTPVFIPSSGTTLKMAEQFSTSCKELYELLLDPQRLSMITGSQAVMEPRPGGKFVLFGGAVVGENLDLIPNTLIKQKWRFASWPADHFSVVSISLSTSKSGDLAVLSLVQEGVPKEDYARTLHGWKENYWERIKMMFGFAAPSMM